MWRILLFLLLGPSTLLAHPVTYEDGSVLRGVYAPDRQELHYHYSLTSSSAVAVGLTRTEDEDGDNVNFIIPRFNYLLTRKNLPGAQANLYLTGGIGAQLGDDSSGVAAIAGIQADYETRRLYTQFNGEAIESESDNSFRTFRGRVGIAPYKAEFDELQTFIILESLYATNRKNNFHYGPVLRLFYNEYLLEVGIHQDGDVNFRAMIHF